MSGLATYLLHNLLSLLLSHIASVWTPSARVAPARLLIYSATQRFRHDSIPTAISALQGHGASIDAIFDATEDASQFNDANLAKYDALIFLSTTGEVLPNDIAFQRYINTGGNFVGIHSASDTLRNSTAYARELGSRFDYHPPLQNFTVTNLEPTHPSVNMLPSRWDVLDEPYNFEIDPRSLGAKVVLGADESTITDDSIRRYDQGSPHPIAWYQERGGGVQSGGIAGRSFYTSLGHRVELWNDTLFIGHVLGGISWVLKSNTTRAFNSTTQDGNPQPSTSQTSGVARPTGSVKSSSSLQKPLMFWIVVQIALAQYYFKLK